MANERDLDEKSRPPSEDEVYGACVSDLELIVGSLGEMLTDLSQISRQDLLAKPLIRNRARVQKAGEVLADVLQKARGV